MAAKWFADNGQSSSNYRKGDMLAFLLITLLLNFTEFSEQSSQCKEKFIEEPDGKYKFVVDCSNLGLETFPNDLSDLTTSLYLNGNRLKNINKNNLKKLVLLQNLDLSGNDLTSLPQGIFEHATKLKTLDLRRNRLHCDWRVWWLVNFTKTLEQFNGYCFSPSSLRGRDVRKLTEKDVIVDCESKRRLHKNSKDGHYIFSVAGSFGNSIELLIYCHKMQSAAPKEYLSLPSGKQSNYVRSTGTKIAACFDRNVTSNDLTQFIGFNKVRILLRTMAIVTDDLTFSTSTKKTDYGAGRVCGLIDNTTCIGADASIDLRGTPFRIKNNVKWKAMQGYEDIDVVRKSGGAVVEIKCSKICGGCSSTGPLSLELMNAKLVPFEACTRPFGMQDGSILSANITTSSFLDRNFLPSYARLHGNGHGGWCAAKQDKNQFIQVDLGVMHTISGVSTQGYKTYNDWVTSYKLKYKTDDDDAIWREYTIFGNPKIFAGNSDSNTVVTHWLEPRLRASSVRIQPISWYDGDLLDHRICLRFELFGCKNDVASYVVKLGGTKPCLVPVKSGRNITDGEAITYDAKCSGKNFMFQLKNNMALVHTLSGYCLDMSSNSTAILTSSCQQSRFVYQRIDRGGSQRSSFIIKDKITKKCIRLKRAKNKRDISVVLKRCSDLSQILLILSKEGVVPLIPHFKEPREARKVDMWSSQTFSCEFVSDPPSLFAWSVEAPLTHGGRILHGDNFIVLSNGSLLIRNVTWNDRGNYFCNVLNSEGSETKLIELDVHAVQNYIKIPKSQVTIVGKTVKFDCIVEGIPTPRILWKFMPLNSKNYMRIDSLDQRRFKLSPDGSLAIKNVHLGDRGVYVCIAKSPGKKNNVTADLVVYVPPRITLSATKKSVFVGESARVNCMATGVPYPKISWYNLLDVNSTNPKQRGLADGNISLERVTKKDQGMYVCEATNVVGKATASFQLTVTATCRLTYVRYANVYPKKSFHIENQQVRFSCQKGFRLVGASVLECTQYGNWSEPFPRCVDIDECNSPTELSESSGYMLNQDTEPDICHVNAVCTNTIGSFKCTCEEGFVGNGFTCNWRSTTTKSPTTVTTKPTTTVLLQTETKSIETNFASETKTKATLLTTALVTASFPTLTIVIQNYTRGLMSELIFLEHLLAHSQSIKSTPGLDNKVQSLNISMFALENLLTVKSKEHDQEKNLKNFVVFTNVVSNLLDDQNADVWNNLQEKSPGSSKLMSIFDQYTRRQLNNFEGSNKKNDAEIVTKNIVVKIHELKSTPNGVELSIAAHDKSNKKPRVVLSNENIENDKQSTAVLVWFKTLSEVLSKQTEGNTRLIPLSNVISLTISSIKDGTTLKKPIRMEFRTEKAIPKSPECVFWKFNTTSRGSWSTDGCRWIKDQSEQKNQAKVICECDHLTNFAVIERMPVNGKRKAPAFFILTLSLSVIIGCGISIFFAFITCISHLFFSSHVRSDRRIIMINICACILLGSTVFLGGALLSSFKLIKDDSAKYFCLVMSGSLQLFFVAFFCWMLAEAIQIFLSTKTVIDKSTGKLTLFYLLGWGIPAIVVGGSLLLIVFKKVKITSWCWIDFSSYTHFLLTGVPAFALFVVTLIFYGLICSSLKKNNDLLNPFVQRYTKIALWLSPVLLILHVMTILALAAFLSFNQRYICHYILGALYGVEGLFLIVYQCYVEKMVLSRSGAMSPKTKKRQHSYSVKDTVTYGDETCIEDGSGKYLIRRPSKRSLQDSGRNSVSLSVGVSKKSDLDAESDSHYFDMYGTSPRFQSGKQQRVPVVKEDEVDENGELLHDNEGSDESSEADSSEIRETQLTSFDVGHLNKKPASNCGSVLSIETKPRPPLQGIPVYFPGSGPPQHQLTLERPKEKEKHERSAEVETYDNVDIDATSSNNTRESMDPETISNISSELSSILKELEAFSDEPTPKLIRKKESDGAANADPKKSPSVWQRRRPPYQRQNHVEMKDIHFGTVPSNKADWYGVKLKDSGDGLHKCTDDLYTSF